MFGVNNAENTDGVMSGVERRPGSHSRPARDFKRAAIYMDYDEDLCESSGIYTDSEGTKESNIPSIGADEHTPLLQGKRRLKSKINEEVSRVESQTNSLLQNADNLSAAIDKYFGEDEKIGPKKQSSLKRLCCFCRK